MELDALYAANGYMNSENGHLYLMIDPYNTHFGFAEFISHEKSGWKSRVQLGIMGNGTNLNLSFIDFEKPLGVKGVFDFEISVK